MIDDLIYMVVMLFLIGLFVIVGYIGFSEMNNAFSNSTLIPQEQKDFFSGQFERYENLDYTFLTIFICIVIAVLLISWVLATYPAFFVVFFFLVILLSALAGVLANTWIDITTEHEILGIAASNFPITSFIIQNYLIFIMVTAVLMILVFFAKPNDAGGGGVF